MAIATASWTVLLRVGPHAPRTAPSATTWPMNSTCASRHGQERRQERAKAGCGQGVGRQEWLQQQQEPCGVLCARMQG